MELYWKGLRIGPGSRLRVEERGGAAGSGGGRNPVVTWHVLDIRSRGEGEDYYDPERGTAYSMRALLRSRKLQRRRDAGQLADIPACTDYLVVREYRDGELSGLRCFSLDMLGSLWDVRPLP
jgi:hypothetical protein